MEQLAAGIRKVSHRILHYSEAPKYCAVSRQKGRGQSRTEGGRQGTHQPVGVGLLHKALCLLPLLPLRPPATPDLAAHTASPCGCCLWSLPLRPHQPQPSSPQPRPLASSVCCEGISTGQIHRPTLHSS